MEQTKFNGWTLVFMLFILCCLAGCKTTRKAETSKFPESTRYLSSKVRLTVPTSYIAAKGKGQLYQQVSRDDDDTYTALTKFIAISMQRGSFMT